MAFSASPFLIDRETGVLTFSYEYFIPAYIDPETGEVFDQTFWTLAIAHLGVSSGSTFDFGGESGQITYEIPLLGGDAVNRYRLDFSAINNFSAVSVSEGWNLIIAAYASIGLTLDGGNEVDLIIGGLSDDVLNGLDGNDILDGGEGEDQLNGGLGADRLNGGFGDDTMSGGAGNDTYTVDAESDVVVELADEGDDTVLSSVGYILSGNIERLVLTGDGNIVGTGNSGDNIITGNDGLNILDGADGDDVMDGGASDDQLFGGEGDDMLKGGAGFDRLYGGNGDDMYVIDAFDLVTETDDALSGTDTVVTAAEMSSYTMGANIEILLTLSNTAFNGRGNSGNNEIHGGIAGDFLQGFAGNDVLVGAGGDDRLDGGVGADALFGDGGEDTAVYSDSATAVQINLALAFQSGGDAAGDSLFDVENIIGSNHNDTLIGIATDNVLEGGDGDDTIDGAGGDDRIVGGRGADALDGGNGKDTLDYSGGGDGVLVNLRTNTVSGGEADGDTIANFENVYGSNLSDTLVGDALANELRGNGGADIIYGGDGNDTIMGGAGGDWLDGEGGVNTLSYAGADLGVLVDLLAMHATGGQAFGDRIFNFDNVRGGRGDDALYGNDDANKLNGAVGNDLLYGRGGDDILQGGAGSDVMNGGGGKDTVTYTGSTVGVSVDLATGQGLYGDAAGDVLISIENLEGGLGGDILRGNAGNNRVSGGTGNDFLDGAAGFDTLVGGAGNDTFRYHTGFDRDTINDFTHGEDQLFIDFDGGFTDWSQVMSFATATGPGGAHTVFNFGAGDELVVLNMRPQDFTANDFTPFS